MTRPIKPRSRERGSVLVEMAFALPILAVILLSIIDLGLIVREYQLVQNAAREGAHYSALQTNNIFMSTDPNAICTRIRQFVVDYAAQENIVINSSSIAITQSYPIPGGYGSEVTVTYTRPVLLLGAPFLPVGSLTLTGRSVFHNLYGSVSGASCP